MLLLNYRPIPQKLTGIGIVAEALRPALSEIPHQYLAGGHGDGALQRLQREAWNQSRLRAFAEASKATLIFTPVPEGYLGEQHIPQAVFVHDLRPLLHPSDPLQSLYYRKIVPRLLAQCRHILTNSRYTLHQIANTLDIPERKITAIPLAIDQEVFKPSPTAQKQPYLLNVGHHYPHKNQLSLLRAFAKLSIRNKDLKLIMVGKYHARHSKNIFRAIQDLSLESRVNVIPYASQQKLVELYQSALALIFPSLWEGYGLPIIEAMACGTPVITSRGSGCEETANGAALLIDPHSLSSIEEGIGRLVDEPTLQRELTSLGLARTSGLSWDKAGLEARSCLESLL